MDFRVRELLPADFQHVNVLYREMLEEKQDPGGYPNKTELEREVEEFNFFGLKNLKYNPAWKGFVALDGNVAKAFTTGSLCHRIVGQPMAYLLGETLFVSAKFRHKGIGEKLVRAMCAWGARAGAEAFEVSVKPGSEEHKHWARMGFRSYLTQMVLLDKDGKPVVDYPVFAEPKLALVQGGKE